MDIGIVVVMVIVMEIRMGKTKGNPAIPVAPVAPVVPVIPVIVVRRIIRRMETEAVQRAKDLKGYFSTTVYPQLFFGSIKAETDNLHGWGGR